MRLLLLLAVATNACALDCWPDFREDDKQKHAIAGAVVVTLAQPINRWAIRTFMPDASPRARFFARVALDSLEATAVGVGKELLWDARDRDNHTVCARDAVATGVGGLGASLVWNVAIP